MRHAGACAHSARRITPRRVSRWPVVAHQHEDMSDHRFEQRGLLHSEVTVHGQSIHVVVVHLGLIRSSRVRQLAQLQQFIAREVPAGAPVVVAGDFNEWGTLVRRTLGSIGLVALEKDRMATFPSRMPLVQLDHIYARGLIPVGLEVPHGRIWWRMSDHLPLIAAAAGFLSGALRPSFQECLR